MSIGVESSPPTSIWLALVSNGLRLKRRPSSTPTCQKSPSGWWFEYTPEVEDLTPIDTGYLAASTDSRVEMVSEDTVRIQTIQSAQAGALMDGRYYGRFVDVGHTVMGGPFHSIPLYWWEGYHYTEKAFENTAPRIIGSGRGRGRDG